MATRTPKPKRGQATRIARAGSEDVDPMDPGIAYDGEEAEPMIDTLKPARKKRGRQPSRGSVDVSAGTISEAEEELTVQKPGRGKTGKGEEVEQQLWARTPTRGRPRKSSRPARPKPIEPDQDLPAYEDEEAAGTSRLVNPKPLTRKRGKDRERVHEPELDTPLEGDALGPSNALNEDVVPPTAAAEVQPQPVEETLAQLQQAVSAVSQPADQPERSPSSWIPWAIQFVVLLAIVSGISYFGYAQFLEINSTVDTRVKTVEKQVQQIMNLELPIIKPEPRRVDWFSFGLGALPQTDLCTPPYRSPPALTPTKKWFWNKPVAVIESPEARLKRLQIEKIVSPLNASQALLHWDEPSPRYCVEAADDGKLQLAVITPRPITPKELVIEHYHKDEVLQIGTAPRDVELWMSTQTAAQRKLLNDQINKNHTHIQTIRSRSSPSKQDATKLNADWIPVGRWRYNIWAEDNVQKFRIEVEMGDVSSRKFALRVMNNWGNPDLICLVRARLHGIDRSNIRERLQPERVVTEGESQSAEGSE